MTTPAAPAQPGAQEPQGTKPEGGEPQGGAPQSKPGPKPAEPTQVDLASLPASELTKVLENPELWKQPRIAELLEASKKLKSLETEQTKQTEAQLVEQKKFEELATKRGDENAKLKEQVQTMRVDQALTNKLVGLNVIDLEGALKLVDRSKIEVDENGAVSGVEEALNALKEGKAYLFNQGGSETSLGTAPNGQGAPGPSPKFKRSQLQDPKFYAEHREDILKAAAIPGGIEDDL